MRIAFFWGFFRRLVVADRMAVFAENGIRCRVLRLGFYFNARRTNRQPILSLVLPRFEEEGIAATFLKQMR